MLLSTKYEFDTLNQAFPTFCWTGNEMLRLLNGTIGNHRVGLFVAHQHTVAKNRHRYNHSQGCFLVHTSYVYTSSFILTETQFELERPRSTQQKCY